MRNLFFPPILSRGFVLKTLALVWLVRLGLWLLPFQFTRRLTRWLARPATEFTGWPAAEQIGWAAEVASQLVPRATCLTQALAAQILLRRYGHPASLCIGVTRGQNDQFEAHAWVECGGAVIIGGENIDLAQYTVLPSLEAAQS